MSDTSRSAAAGRAADGGRRRRVLVVTAVTAERDAVARGVGGEHDADGAAADEPKRPVPYGPERAAPGPAGTGAAAGTPEPASDP
ncbi:hypothetical protein RKE29_20015, partial [Streptomyces sp. B1866]|nr:hypothetical protein [Streptomyces sp. B1866]